MVCLQSPPDRFARFARGLFTVGLTLALVLALTLACPAQAAGDGAALYRAHCASCHDHASARVPPASALKAMTPAAVHEALTAGSMREQARGLSDGQLLAVIAYIAPSGRQEPAGQAPGQTCREQAPRAAPAAAWNGWSTSPSGSRFQDAAAAGLIAADLPRLKLKWAFNLGAVTAVRAQPVVAGGRVFITTTAGTVFALDMRTGCSYWRFQGEAGIRAPVTLGEGKDADTVYFGDEHASFYALEAASGKLLWKVHPATHPAAWITSAPRYYQGSLYQGLSSSEEVLAASPLYDCCSFRGSVVALEAGSGKIRWQSFTITAQPAGSGHSHGPSGAAIWATPTIDEQRRALYVATGDNYTAPATATSDAILAMDLASGAVLWSRQLTGQDAYNLGCITVIRIHCPRPAGPDLDFGQPPILVQLQGAQRALVIAQKSGMAHALDPDREGAILWQTRVSQGGSLGGSQWGSGTDGQKLYVAISDVAFHGLGLNLTPGKGGGLSALELGTGKILWSAPPVPCPRERPRCSPAQSAAVTVIEGAIFSGSVDGHLRAYSALTGKVLWDFDTQRDFPAVNGKPARGGSLDAGGPAVVAGMLFVGSGYAQWGGAPGNVLLAFSLDGA